MGIGIRPHFVALNFTLESAVKLGEVLASNRFCGNWVSLDNTRGMSFSGVKLGVGVWDISIAV